MAKVAVVTNPRRRRRAAPKRARRRRRNPGSYTLTNPRRRRRRHRNPFAGGARHGLGSVVGLAGDAALVTAGMVGGKMLADRVLPDSLGTWPTIGVRLLLAVGVEKFGTRMIGQRAARSVAVGMAAGAVQDAVQTLGLFSGAPAAAPAAAPVSGYALDDSDDPSLLTSGMGAPVFSQSALGVLSPRF